MLNRNPKKAEDTIEILNQGLGTIDVTNIQMDLSKQASVKKAAEEVLETVPNRMLSISGWFLVAIGTLHIYPSIIVEEKLVVFLNSVKQSNFKT